MMRGHEPDWRDYTIDRRGCGGCTVRQYEAMQARATDLLIALLRARLGIATSRNKPE